MDPRKKERRALRETNDGDVAICPPEVQEIIQRRNRGRGKRNNSSVNKLTSDGIDHSRLLERELFVYLNERLAGRLIRVG